MTPAAPDTIFTAIPTIVTAFTAGAEGILQILMQPPMSWAIALGFAGWGFNKVRSFINP